MSTPEDLVLPVGETLEADADGGRRPELDGPAPPSGRPSLAAARIGRFEILHEIGAGGMGVVYAAYDSTLDRKVAIKLLRRVGANLSRASERLQREAQAMARISHPNVVQIYEVGERDGQIYVAMEFLEGVELTRWIAEASPGWSEIIAVFVQAGRGLQAAHEAGVVHRDFKPDNVVVTRRAREGGRAELRVKVLDFGIAAVARGDLMSSDDGEGGPISDDPSRLTLTGSVMGTPRYMSPEHFQSRGIDPRSDQYSFALALYEALYGERAFAGESFGELREAVLAGALRPTPRSEVPAWARDILVRALARDPADRWASMEELLTVLAEHPDRTVDPDLDRTIALRQRAWMFSVISVAALGLFTTLVYLRLTGGADDLAAFAFWSKTIFAVMAMCLVVAAKHVFTRNTYNRWVGAMLLSMAGGVFATAIAADALALPPGEADRFVLIVIAVGFAQGSAGISRWYAGVAGLGMVGLAASFVVPFIASLTLGICVLVGVGLTAYQWRRRARSPATSRTTRTSRSDLDRSSRDRRSRESGRSVVDRGERGATEREHPGDG